MQSKNYKHHTHCSIEKSSQTDPFQPTLRCDCSAFYSSFESRSIEDQFEERFQQFNNIESMVTSFVNPFTNQINVTEITAYISEFLQVKREEVEIEILDLQNDTILKTIISDEKFWNIVDRNKFPFLKRAAYKIKSFFGSTYLCESLFSTMNIIKSKYRSRLIDEHLDDCLRAGISSYSPNYEALASELQSQRSH